MKPQASGRGGLDHLVQALGDRARDALVRAARHHELVHLADRVLETPEVATILGHHGSFSRRASGSS